MYRIDNGCNLSLVETDDGSQAVSDRIQPFHLLCAGTDQNCRIP